MGLMMQVKGLSGVVGDGEKRGHSVTTKMRMVCGIVMGCREREGGL